jgi:hypothetical protein
MFCVSHLRPPTVWTAIEHGRKHSGTATQRASEWMRLKRKGVKAGLPDLWFLTLGRLLCVELKAGKNDATDAQDAFGAALNAIGHGYIVVRSVEQLGEALDACAIPLAAGWRMAAQNHDRALDTVPKPTRKPSKPRAAKPTRAQIARGNAASLMGARR